MTIAGSDSIVATQKPCRMAREQRDRIARPVTLRGEGADDGNHAHAGEQQAEQHLRRQADRAERDAADDAADNQRIAEVHRHLRQEAGGDRRRDPGERAHLVGARRAPAAMQSPVVATRTPGSMGDHRSAVGGSRGDAAGGFEPATSAC